MANWTPGPWRVAQEEPDAWVTMSDGHTFSVGDTLYHPATKANAHLIAAAPDLLAACEMVLKKLPDGFANSYLSLKTQLQNAIAKANPPAPGAGDRR